MKKMIFLLLLAFGTGVAQAQVKFETQSTDAVRELAIKQGKLVFIDLYANWCPPCRMMEREVFSRKDVGEFMDQHFVAAKYDTDKTTGRQLMKRYGSGSIPLYLVFDTRGELLGRIQGAADARTFIDNLRTIIAGQKPTRKQP
ncbi:thioredoxin family protein [Alistipes sp.]|uniref:thioredoxin family protein n=1 Tax=Alistipes sp. TaxID=1872444 RepID=UPI0025C40EF1|nr:thioredoxin family protein [Alistipes sp.]